MRPILTEVGETNLFAGKYSKGIVPNLSVTIHFKKAYLAKGGVKIHIDVVYKDGKEVIAILPDPIVLNNGDRLNLEGVKYDLTYILRQMKEE